MESEKMKAIVCTAYGSPDVLEVQTVNKPQIKADEYLIKIMASAVNSGDVRVRALRANWFQRILMRLIIGLRKPRKPILGTVFSGIVAGKGEKAQEFAIGDEVYGLTGFGFGAHAEYIAVKAGSITTRKPVNASFEEAAAIAFGGQTAYFFLHKAAIAEGSGKKVLIYGATGAVGTAAVQIAKYFGAHVTSVCSENGYELARRIGADEIINYKTQDVKKLPNKYDIVFDAVGKLPGKTARGMLTPQGVYCTAGGLQYASEQKIQLEFLRKLFEEGKYDAAIDRVYNFSDCAEAHRYVDTDKKKGNVVLSIGHE
ncbi:MAG: NAD(P)-dependent alcohol dehydrogenase [Bacteroidia bacterium]